MPHRKSGSRRNSGLFSRVAAPFTGMLGFAGNTVGRLGKGVGNVSRGVGKIGRNTIRVGSNITSNLGRRANNVVSTITRGRKNRRGSTRKGSRRHGRR